MVVRDHLGTFIEGKNTCIQGLVSVFEIEFMVLKEILSLMMVQQTQREIIELDSVTLMMVRKERSLS